MACSPPSWCCARWRRARLVPIRACPAERPGPGPSGESGAADSHRRPAWDRGSGGCAVCQRSGPRPGSCCRCAGTGIRAACRRRAARLAAGASWPGIAGAAPLLSSRVRSLRRTAPAGGRLAATASRPPHGCARKPAICRAEGRHAGGTWVARCTFASQSRNRRGLPGKRHPERSADRRQRKNASPWPPAQAITQLIHSATTSGLPAVPAAARAASTAGPSSQDKPGLAAGAAAPDLAWTDLPVPAERGRRVQGQPVPIPHRELLKREVPLSKINSAAWRDFPVHCYSRADVTLQGS